MLKGVNEDLALPLLASRPIVKPNAANAAHLTGKVVLVTGAGGSIGSELVMQVAAASPAKLILVDHSELALYEINLTLVNSNLPFEVVPLLCDIRDRNSLWWVFNTHQPEVVFHAAALKHVPLLENGHNLVEAVRTNVLGTKTVLDMAVARGADFLLVSTDKAVNPTSGMGLTKRCAELVVADKAITDKDLTDAITRQQHKINNAPEIRKLIAKFNNEVLGKQSRDIPQPRRAEFLMELSQLT